MTELSLPVGDTLVGVSYERLDWEEAPTRDSPVDEVAMALTLFWQSSPATRISWSSDAESEGLVLGGPTQDDPGAAVEIVDVSSRWCDLIGQRLTAFTSSHSRPPSQLSWAMNLSFSSGSHLVVALGELLGGEPSYIPDALLVIASRDIAVAFTPPAALGTAWSDQSP